MSYLPPAHHETSKRDSPSETKIKEKQNETILDSNSNLTKSMTHHNQTKELTTWFLSFTLADTPMDKRVKFAEVFFTMKADHWLRSSGINTNSINWAKFAILISNRFVAESNFEILDNFRHKEQKSTINAYIDAFEEIMGKVKIHTPSATEDYFIGCFLSGLKEHIKIPLRSHNPRTLVHAYSLARNYGTTIQKKPISESLRWNSKPPYAGRTTSVF
jgi:hypothetical protein